MTDAVRRATAEDAEALTACIRAAYAPYAALDLPDVAGGIAGDIAAHFVCVHDIQGAVRGGIVISRQGDTAQIRNLAVHPASGGQGIGSALICTAVRYLAGEGTRTVDLTTHVGMPQNISFYGRLGWVEAGRSGDQVFMTRQLIDGCRKQGETR